MKEKKTYFLLIPPDIWIEEGFCIKMYVIVKLFYGQNPSNEEEYNDFTNCDYFNYYNLVRKIKNDCIKNCWKAI